MEKIIAVFLCVCLFLTPVTVEAKKKATSGVDENGNKWTYDTTTKTLTFSGTKDIEDFSMNGHDPEPAWYEWSEKTEHIVIEDGITGIGENAFYLFTEVTTVTMGDSVKKIKAMAFDGNVSLKSIRLSPNITIIENNALSGCQKLSNVSLPSRLKKMCSFSGNSKLKKIELPDTIEYMESCMFCDCKEITDIHLPAKLKTIQCYDFANCRKLIKLDIPTSVKKVYMSAFAGSGLKNIVLPKNVKTIKNGDHGNKVFKYIKGNGYPTKNLRVIEIHSKKVKSIQKNSFSGLSSKVVIKVPKSRKKKYTKMLRKSGLSKKVKIKSL